MEPAGVEFSHSISVRRLNDPRRTSMPFTEADWLRVRQVGQGIDAELLAQDVRLTMGGEPTYVGIDEPESPQWNIDALGSMKRTRGLALIQCLRKRMAPGALLHYGQGKWYPGEPLPRWALSCYWRADGVPVWKDAKLIAQADHEYKFGATEAFRFMEALALRLQVSLENILPAFDPESESRNRLVTFFQSVAGNRRGNCVGRVSYGFLVRSVWCCRRAIRRLAIVFRPYRCPGSRQMSLNTSLMLSRSKIGSSSHRSPRSAWNSSRWIRRPIRFPQSWVSPKRRKC